MPTAVQGKKRSLQAELRETRARLAELEATLNAIRSGEVDAVVVEGPEAAGFLPLKPRKSPIAFSRNA